MHRLGIGFALGMLLLLIGASIAVDVLFHVTFPLVPLALAILLIGWGSHVVVRSLARRDASGITSGAWLADRHFAPSDRLDTDVRYDVVFGRGVIDLSKVPEPDHDVTVTVDTVFGASVIKLDPQVPYDVRGSSTFSDVRMPDRRSEVGLSNVSYRHAAADHPPRLHFKLNTVFGQCQLVEAP